MYYKSFTVAAVLAAITNQASATKCYAVAFGSGGQDAAYQAGVIKGLSEAHGSEIAYSAISGISGGAVNAAILGSFAPGQESSAADRMYKFWDDAANNKLQ